MGNLRVIGARLLNQLLTANPHLPMPVLHNYICDLQVIGVRLLT